MSAPVAIRIRRLGRYFGPRVEMDGAERPREAFRALLRIAGINLKETEQTDPQVTFAVAGHVLRDVSLDIEKGQIVCLTGPSGSGKTVLLKLLAGVQTPTSGSVEIFAPVTTLLSIGGNLDVSATARENIEASSYFINATLKDAERYARAIIDFAELHGFEHAPLRTYSTGMVLRLSVGIALCGRPSILLLDDVLNVGDIGFQQKCVDRLYALKEAGSTLVMALSDDALVQQLATRVITLSAGRVVGDAPALLAPAQVSRAADVEWRVLENLPEDDLMRVGALAVESIRGDDGDGLEITATFAMKAGGLRCRPVVNISSPSDVLFRSVCPEFIAVGGPESLTFTVRVPVYILPNGEYSIGFHMASVQGDKVFALKVNDAVRLKVRHDTARPADGEPVPSLSLPLQWEVEPVGAEAVAS